MSIDKILSKLFHWIWETQGDYDSEREDHKPAQLKETCLEYGEIICSPSGLKRKLNDPLI